jgi:predicted O-methyltransferase YrrM
LRILKDSVTSVEDDRAWYEEIKARLEAAAIDKVEMIHAPTNEMHKAIDGLGEFSVIYVDPMDQKARVRCIAASVAHVKRGGYLVADDYNFPGVKRQIDKLRGKWGVAIVAGTKVHSIRGVMMATSTAFCRRPE